MNWNDPSGLYAVEVLILDNLSMRIGYGTFRMDHEYIMSAEEAVDILKRTGNGLQKSGAKIACNLFILAQALDGGPSGVDGKACKMTPFLLAPLPMIDVSPCGFAIGLGYYEVGGLSDANSFEAGTLVETREGLRRIESVAPGAEVAALDPFTGAKVFRPCWLWSGIQTPA